MHKRVSPSQGRGSRVEGRGLRDLVECRIECLLLVRAPRDTYAGHASLPCCCTITRRIPHVHCLGGRYTCATGMSFKLGLPAFHESSALVSDPRLYGKSIISRKKAGKSPWCKITFAALNQSSRCLIKNGCNFDHGRLRVISRPIGKDTSPHYRGASLSQCTRTKTMRTQRLQMRSPSSLHVKMRPSPEGFGAGTSSAPWRMAKKGASS